MELIIHQLADLDLASKKIRQFAGDRKKWCFYGEVGAGKTTFIKAICQEFNVQQAVTSPTYSLVNEYTYLAADGESENYLYHLDLYRLRQIEEALDIGIEEYLYNPHYCFIEWAEIIKPILPENTFNIFIEIIEDNTRKIVCF